MTSMQFVETSIYLNLGSMPVVPLDYKNCLTAVTAFSLTCSQSLMDCLGSIAACDAPVHTRARQSNQQAKRQSQRRSKLPRGVNRERLVLAKNTTVLLHCIPQHQSSRHMHEMNSSSKGCSLTLNTQQTKRTLNHTPTLVALHK